MASNKLKIQIIPEFDEFVKLVCVNSDCKHNLLRITGNLFCAFKHITITEDGKCKNFELIEK